MSRLTIACLFLVAMFSAGSAFAGKAHFVYDVRSGKVLAAQNADALNHPASLTKMMTLYMTFDAIRRGRLSWDTPVTFSKHAASRPPTKLFVKAGQSVTVRDAVYGMIVVSANDAAAAIAEKLGGSESGFAAAMTKRARQLGMSRTTFVNASGLPDSRQITTARDMAMLGVALLRDFPKEYRMFSTQSFVFKGRRIRGHNNLMYRYDGMDGIKTGYTNASGFNLVSAVRDGDRRVVGVVLGGTTAASRDRSMAALLDEAMEKAASGGQLVAAARPAPAAAEAQRRQSAAAGADSDDEDDADEAAERAVPIPSNAPRYEDMASLLRTADESDGVPVPASRYASAATEPKNDAVAAIAAQTAAKTVVPAAPMRVASAVVPGRRGSWQIQIAAADSREAALDLLATARSRAGPILSGREPYTEAVKTGSSTLYRARFVGFASRQDAETACAGLSKLDYDCMMMPDRG